VNLMHFLTKKVNNIANILPIWACDQFPLDDEAIADMAINAMLLVMNNSTRHMDKNTNETILDYAALSIYGVRFPWKDRICFGTEIDLVNDDLADMAVIGLTRKSKDVFASAIYACKVSAKDTPKHKALSGAIAVYRVGWIEGKNPLSRAYCVGERGDIESITRVAYAGVMPDGCCVGCKPNGEPFFWAAGLLAYVQGMHNDRRYFWDVQATEEFWDGLPAKAHFSIDKEYVKSLFYARSLPETDKGRLRPILHWVRAHKRRMKEGIDIDINKHLRGIDAFNMHGLNFSINAPRKATGNKSKIVCAA